MIGIKKYTSKQTIPVMILSADFISFIRRRVLEEEKYALEQYLISDWQDGWGKRWSTRVGSRRVRIRGRAKGGKAGWWWGGQSFWGNPQLQLGLIKYESNLFLLHQSWYPCSATYAWTLQEMLSCPCVDTFSAGPACTRCWTLPHLCCFLNHQHWHNYIHIV